MLEASFRLLRFKNGLLNGIHRIDQTILPRLCCGFDPAEIRLLDGYNLLAQEFLSWLERFELPNVPRLDAYVAFLHARISDIFKKRIWCRPRTHPPASMSAILLPETS